MSCTILNPTQVHNLTVRRQYPSAQAQCSHVTLTALLKFQDAAQPSHMVEFQVTVDIMLDSLAVQAFNTVILC